MQVDVVVEGEDGADAELTHHGDGVAQDQHQDQHRVVQQHSTCEGKEEKNILIISSMSRKIACSSRNRFF